MATGSADCFRFRGSFEGCISGHDSNFSHRPYHKNCRCALHDKSRRPPSSTSGLPPPPLSSRCNSVSFPIRRSRSESSLAFAVSASVAAGASPVSSFATPSSSPVAPIAARLSVLEISDVEDGDDLFPRLINR